MKKVTCFLAVVLILLWTKLPSTSLAQSTEIVATLIVGEPKTFAYAGKFIDFPITVTNTSKEVLVFTQGYPYFTPQLYDENDSQQTDQWMPEKKRIEALPPVESVTVTPRAFEVRPGETVHDTYVMSTRLVNLHSGFYVLKLVTRTEGTNHVIVSPPLRFRIVLPTDSKPAK